MVVLRSCKRGRGTSAAPWALVALTAIFAASLGGCGHRTAYGPTPPSRLAPPVAVAASAGDPTPRTELEDDGLPAQTPPLLNRRRYPDNPAEPFSPNYGGAPVKSAVATGGEAVKAVSARDLPDDLPPDFRERLIVAAGTR